MAAIRYVVSLRYLQCHFHFIPSHPTLSEQFGSFLNQHRQLQGDQDDDIDNYDLWPALVESTPFGETSTAIVCDTFDREDGTDGEGWYGDDNTLLIENNKVSRNPSILGWQFASYGANGYDVDDPRVRVSVTDSQYKEPGSGSMGVALALGLEGTTVAPAFILVLDAINNQVFTVCSFETGRDAWGSLIVSLPGAGANNTRAALGSSFTLEAVMDPVNGESSLIVSDIAEGDYAGTTITFECGVFPQFAKLGNIAGLGIFGNQEDFGVAVNDFAHSGCQEADPGCEDCNNVLGQSGVKMELVVRNFCIVVCAPTWVVPIVQALGAQCGTCSA
jgi:hypothetical protein